MIRKNNENRHDITRSRRSIKWTIGQECARFADLCANSCAP